MPDRHVLFHLVRLFAVCGGLWGLGGDCFEVEFAAGQVDHGGEVVHVPESACPSFDVLDDAVDALEDRVGVPVGEAGRDLVPVPAECVVSSSAFASRVLGCATGGRADSWASHGGLPVLPGGMKGLPLLRFMQVISDDDGPMQCGGFLAVSQYDDNGG